MLDEMLVHGALPRLRGTVSTIPKMGCEDDEEIIQDATHMAARMMDSAEKAGKTFTAGNMAWFTRKTARSGHRSYYTGHSDVMSPGCQIAGHLSHDFFDKETVRESGETRVLHVAVAPF